MNNISFTSVSLISSIIFNFTNIVLEIDGLNFLGTSTSSNLLIVSSSQITINDIKILNSSFTGISAFFNFSSSSLDFKLLSLTTI